MADKCFCHLGDFEVKDAQARRDIEEMKKNGVGNSTPGVDLETFAALEDRVIYLEENGTGGSGAQGPPGADGTSVTITNVTESSADGGNNVVTFSDGTTLTVKNGSKGSAGTNGTNGTNGVGISNAAINSSGELVLTFTNGTTKNVGKVVGEDGADGTNGTNGATGADGRGISNAAISSEGNLFLYFTDGTSKNVGKVVGEDGEDGADGAAGSATLTWTTLSGTGGKYTVDMSNLGGDGLYVVRFGTGGLNGIVYAIPIYYMSAGTCTGYAGSNIKADLTSTSLTITGISGTITLTAIAKIG